MSKRLWKINLLLINQSRVILCLRVNELHSLYICLHFCVVVSYEFSGTQLYGLKYSYLMLIIIGFQVIISI